MTQIEKTSPVAVLAGSTGLVGSEMLRVLANNCPGVSTVYAYTRRELPAFLSSVPSKIVSILSTDSENWPNLFPKLDPPPSMFLSGLASTAATAGGAAGRHRIDHDLNVALAKAARNARVPIYVLVSAAGCDISWPKLAYSQTKLETERDVIALGFPYTIIIRPALILGEREAKRPAEYAAQMLAYGVRKVVPSLVQRLAQDSDVIARAGLQAAELCLKGMREPGVWYLNPQEIWELGSGKPGTHAPETSNESKSAS